MTRLSSPVVTWRSPALAGVTSAALGLGVASVVAALLGSRGFPLSVVSAAVIDRVPSWLKEWAIDWFGSSDKAVLVGVVAALLAGIAAAAGIVGATSRISGLLLAALPPVVGVAAALTRPATTPIDALPAVVGGIAGLASLDWALGRYQARTEPATEPRTGPHSGAPDRRSFLRAVGGTALLAIVTGGLGVALSGRRRSIEAARATVGRMLRLPKAVPPAGTDLDLPGAASWQTPNGRFYRVDTAVAVPLLAVEDWRLRVHGLVANEIDLDFDGLLARDLVDRWITLTCVSNEVGGDLVGNALWTGVLLAPLIAEAGPRAGADAVKSTSADGFTVGTPLAALTDGRDAMLAVGMNGQPLPVEHGFPVRMVVPGLYGFVSATKWVVDIEVTRFAAFDAYWTSRGWSELAPIKISSRIDVPRAATRLGAGRVMVAGTAWAQGYGVGKVEVRVDEGAWQPATLADVPSVDTWRQWKFPWDAAPGTHRLQVRATNGAGAVQTEHRQGPVPDGATGWHTIEVTVEG